MKSLLTRAIATLVVCIAAPIAVAQVVPIPFVMWKYQQPWTKPWHSHASVVRDCTQAGPVPFAPIALDDWICTSSGPIVRVSWWGTSPQPAQIPNRPFLIAIYSDVQCRPAQLLYRTCVLATSQYVGYDCRDRRVYRFNANLPTGAAGFSQVAGTHYWLQISEIDFQPGTPFVSPTVNAIDFEWSAHRPIKNCPALQRTPAGVFIQPLLDQCDQLEEDLAFVLYRKAIIIHVPPVDPTTLTTLPRPVYIAEFRKAGDMDTLAASVCFTPDDDGSALLDAELAPGQYQVIVRGGSFRPSFFDVFFDIGLDLGGGSEDIIDLGELTAGQGDVNGDGKTNFMDITGVLGGWAP